MPLKRLLAASAVALIGGVALCNPAWAATPASQATTQPAPPQHAAPARPAAKPVKPTAEQRAEAERLDPLGRSAFWARVVDVDPMDLDARLKLAKALRALGKFDEAGQAADRLLVLQPKNYEAMLESARDKVATGEGFYAIDLVRRAEQMQPKDWRPVALEAVALGETDRNEEALAAHKRALAMAPDNPATLTNLGMYYATHGDARSAEPLLRQAAAAPGAGAQERQNLALVLGLEGKFDEAERLQRLDLPPETVNANLGYLRAASGEGQQAHSWDALRANP